MGPNQMAILVHDALQRAGYATAPTLTAPGYVVGAVKTLAGQPTEVEVSHTPVTDDPDGHARAYYSALATDSTLAGLTIEYFARPYPNVRVRG